MENLNKQKTIGISPLDDYLSNVQIKTEKKENAEVKLEEKQESIESLSKERITLHISSSIVNRIKNAVYWEPGLTIAGFAEIALEKAMNELEAQKGECYPNRKEHKLRGGRPIK